MVVLSKLYRYKNRSRHLQSKFCDIGGYYGKITVGRFVYERPCIESTASADMQKSLHLKRRAYILRYHFS